MSRRYFADINLHIIWHTKGSAPSLTAELAEVAYRDIREGCYGKPGVILHEIGGIETHVHVAVAVPPNLLISEFIGHLKGGSSHAVNGHASGRAEKFAWQEGYGVASFGTRQLRWVVDYIRNQREHHAAGSTNDLLERCEVPDRGDPAAASPSFDRLTAPARFTGLRGV